MIGNTKSDLDSEKFAILDVRSRNDESVLLVLILQGFGEPEIEVETMSVAERLVSDILAT